MTDRAPRNPILDLNDDHVTATIPSRPWDALIEDGFPDDYPDMWRAIEYRLERKAQGPGESIVITVNPDVADALVSAAIGLRDRAAQEVGHDTRPYKVMISRLRGL